MSEINRIPHFIFVSFTRGILVLDVCGHGLLGVDLNILVSLAEFPSLEQIEGALIVGDFDVKVFDNITLNREEFLWLSRLGVATRPVPELVKGHVVSIGPGYLLTLDIIGFGEIQADYSAFTLLQKLVPTVKDFAEVRALGSLLEFPTVGAHFEVCDHLLVALCNKWGMKLI